MREHQPTPRTRPTVRIRRLALIRTDGRRFSVLPTTRQREMQMQLFTAPILDGGGFADGEGHVLAGYGRDGPP
jgi:hypothetical protein